MRSMVVMEGEFWIMHLKVIMDCKSNFNGSCYQGCHPHNR